MNGVITAKKNGVTSVCVSDRQFSFDLPSASIPGEVGDSAAFEVVSKSGHSLCLRPMPTPQEGEGNGHAREIRKSAEYKDFKELMEQSDFKEKDIPAADYDELAKARQEEKLQERRAVTKLKRRLSDVADNAGKAVVKALISQGVNANKIGLDTLSGMLTEISRSVSLRPEGSVEVIPGVPPMAAETLRTAGLPPTNRNVAAVTDALAKLETVARTGFESILAFLKSGEALTLTNIYNYSAAKPTGEGEEEAETADLPEDEITKLFAREGIEDSPENREIARLFIASNTPLTKENIDIFQFLTNLSEADIPGLLKQIILSPKTGGNPPDSLESAMNGFPTEPLNTDAYDKLYQSVTVIKTEHIRLALTRDPDRALTIRALSRLAQEGPGVEAAGAEGLERRTSDARLALAEIALKLSYEAANRLFNKNINVDALPLAEAVAALRSLERADASAYLRAMGGEDTPDNARLLMEVTEAAPRMRSLPYAVYGDIASSRIAFTIGALREAAPPDAARVSETYEKLSAVPSRRYGDSPARAREGFPKLLESMGVSATEANVRAARILAANQMELTQDNLLEIKVIDGKLTDVAERLHPMITASMIKEGLNPLDMRVDEVLDYIDAFGDVYGKNPSESVAEHIYALDKSKALDEGQREALIAIYRMLNIIQKNGAESLGAAVKAGTELTLGRLMQMSEALSTHVNLTENDRLAHYISPGKNIRDIFDKYKARKEDAAGYYGRRLVESLSREARPEPLVRAIANTKPHQEPSLEALIEELEAENRRDGEARLEQQAAQIAGELASLENASATSARTLERCGIPLTAQYVAAFDAIMKNREKHKSIFSTAKSERLERRLAPLLADSSLDKLRSGYDAYIESISDALRDFAENAGDMESLEEINAVMRAMQLRYSVQNAQNGYFMPVKFNGKTTDVELYIINEELDSAEFFTIFAALESAAGPVRATVKTTPRGLETAMTLDGAENDYGKRLLAYLTDDEESVASGQENSPIAPGRIPERVRHLASGIIKFAERIENE